MIYSDDFTAAYIYNSNFSALASTCCSRHVQMYEAKPPAQLMVPETTNWFGNNSRRFDGELLCLPLWEINDIFLVLRNAALTL